MKTGNMKFNFSNSLNVQRSSRNAQFDSYNSRSAKHKKMLSHCTLRGEAEICHEDTLTCAVLAFAKWQG